MMSSVWLLSDCQKMTMKKTANQTLTKAMTKKLMNRLRRKLNGKTPMTIQNMRNRCNIITFKHSSVEAAAVSYL